jgi:UDPglucose 6-dehydrogenase
MTPSGRKASETLAGIYRNWVPDDLIIRMDSWSSELSKLAANALLAQRVSSINSLASICEETGADIGSVSMACGLDRRITSAMLQPSLGWGGGCFKKDILCLAYLARSLGLEQVANYWASVVAMNECQKSRFLERIISHMHGCVGKKSIAVLGYAFKKNTSDIKNSAAITLVRGLLKEGAFVCVYDPLVPESRILAESSVGLSKVESEQLQVCNTAYEACTGADAVVVVTDWDDFRTPVRELPQDFSNISLPPTPSSPETDRRGSGPDDHTRIRGSLDWRSVIDSMQGPKIIFDGRNMLDDDYLRGLGCRYIGIGKRAM